MHAGRASDQSPTRLRKAKLGVVGGDDDVARHGQFQAAAQRETVDPRDHRFREVPPLDQRFGLGRFARPLGTLFRGRLAFPGAVLEVGAGTERALAGSGYHGKPDFVVALDLVESSREFPPQVRIE